MRKELSGTKRIRHNLADLRGLEFVTEKLGGEERLKKKYPEVYKMLVCSGKYEQMLANGDTVAPLLWPGSSEGETFGLIDSVGIRTLNYDVSSTAYTSSGMSLVEENKSMVIVGELKDITHGQSLDGFAVTASNSHELDGFSCVKSASLIRDTEYEFLASSTFYKTVIDQEGTPHYVCETQQTDVVKVIDAASIVQELIVNDPIPIKHPGADITKVYYNNRTSSGCDYYYDNVSSGEYDVEVNVDFSGSVTFLKGFAPLYVDKNNDFNLQMINKGAAAFNIGYWNDIVWDVSGQTLSWKFPSNWHDRLQSKLFHAANPVDFYCKMNVATESGLSIPIVISSYGIEHSDPSYKKINQIDIEWGCFAKGTAIIMADGTENRIEEIKTGERVLTQNGSAEVTEVIRGQEEKLICIATGSGNRLLITKDHPVLTEEGWKRANELSAADILLMRHGRDVIKELHMQEYNGPVYSIRIDSEDALIAEGFYAGDFGQQNKIPVESAGNANKEAYQEEMEELIKDLDMEMKRKGRH